MHRDPTTSESYVALRNALLSMGDDASAVLSILSSLSDNGAGWVTTAYHELRRSLVQGRLRESESLGRLIGTVLEVQEQGAADELTENRLHNDAMSALIEGIGAILGQDNDTGIQILEKLTEAVTCNDSLQWVAWLWTAKAAADKGDLARARRAAEAALLLGEKLDPLAQGTSLCTLGEIEFLSGSQEPALQHLAEASSVFDDVGDARGKAMASLTRARMLTRLSRDDEAVEAARQAQAADLDWEEPAVFLSEWLLGRELCAEAEAVIRPFLDSPPVAPQVLRQLRLVRLAGNVPGEVMRGYLDFKERVPAGADLPALQALAARCKSFHALRELLAWNLAKLGRNEEAHQQFDELAAEDLDEEVRASVLLGLGCLASRRFGDRQSSARVRAAASAGPRPAPKPEPPRFAQLDGESLLELIGGPVEPPRPKPIPPPPPGMPPPPGGLQPVSTASHLVMTETPAPAPPPQPPPPPITSKGLGHQAKAVFSGDLTLLAIPDLLEFLKSSRRTGTLVITTAAGIGAVHMRRGMITGAASPNSKNMGQILQQTGELTEAQLNEAAEYQRSGSPNKLFGTILVERGYVSREALQRTLVRQIKGAVMEMVGWTSGRFAFEPDKRGQADESEVEVELDTQAVLLDVLRELDEANRDKFEKASEGSEETTSETL